jgi:DNA-binding CsgD family transcriptional regulator
LDAAATGIRAALEQAKIPGARCRILPPYIEVMLGVKDLEAAREASDELTRLSVGMDAPVLRAAAQQARGAIAFANGDARSALADLRAAWDAWDEVEAPYEAARTRILIGCACRELGDDDAAELELDAARWTFEKLSATPDVERVRSLAHKERRQNGALTDRELQVLRLVAAGHTNRAIAAKLRISEKTVARHVSNIFTKLGLSSRAGATAYAYEHGIAGGGTT